MSSADSSCSSGDFDENPGTRYVEVVNVFNEGTGFGEDRAVRESKTRVNRDGNSTRDYGEDLSSDQDELRSVWLETFLLKEMKQRMNEFKGPRQ